MKILCQRDLHAADRAQALSGEGPGNIATQGARADVEADLIAAIEREVDFREGFQSAAWKSEHHAEPRFFRGSRIVRVTVASSASIESSKHARLHHVAPE